MEVPDRAPAVSPDGRTVVFMLSIRGREVEGAIARDALEEHFWLPRTADATRTLRTFENGRNRIVAVAQRKLLARPDEPMRLTVSDFVTR
jgi:Tol biopolymer transport system component